MARRRQVSSNRCLVMLDRLLDHLFWLMFLGIPALLVPFIWIALIPRIRMERHARRLLAEMPRHEQKVVYLAFASSWWRGGRGKEMEAKIAEEGKAGWTFLRASEVNLFKAFFTRGSVNLHFIRAF